MKNKLVQAKLADIEVSETNKMFRDESELSDDALKELIDSIKQHGVIQPIVLRFNPTEKGKAFILIAGERRYRASVAAGKTEIPAYVMELTDEEAFELQITENLQRKDVHPLKEAHAYKYMMEKDAKNTVAELALRFGKTEHYILTRIKLNALVPKAEKDFHDGIMSLGHALLIARLTPEDQLSTIEACSGSFRNGKELVRYYESIQQVEDHIDTSVICNLSSAAFKKDDATLIPKAGACTTCPQRSGASQLFNDITQKDRCFNPACFLAKRTKFMSRQIPELLEKRPDLLFLKSRDVRDKVDPDIEKVLTENKVKILRYAADFHTYQYGNQAKAKGVWINGDEIGIETTVYLDKVKSSGTTSKDADQVDTKVAIANIKQRTERSAELDGEKVYARIQDALKDHPTQKWPCDAKFYNEAEEAFFTFVIYDKLRFIERDEVESAFKKSAFKINSSTPAELYKSLSKLSTAQKVYMLRRLMIQFFNPMPDTDVAYFIRKIAEGYGDIPIAKFESEQKAIRDKREERAAERIRQLKPAKQKSKVKKAKKEKRSRTIKSKPKKEAVAEEGGADTTASRLPQLF